MTGESHPVAKGFRKKRSVASHMKEYAKEQLAEYLGQWNTVLEAGQRSGDFRADFSTNVFKFIMFGSIDHVIGLWGSNPNRSRDDLLEVGRQLTDAMMRAVIA
ncbi:MAG: hypothetical protein HOI23_11235 [Deltaproteobacteria bacterium]|nr:hypothetical protein [Deltaproteobacteria bacterium]